MDVSCLSMCVLHALTRTYIDIIHGVGVSCVRSFDRYIIHVHQEHQRAIHSRSERAVALPAVYRLPTAAGVGIDENRPRATLNDDGEGLCGPWAAIFISLDSTLIILIYQDT